MAKIRWSNHPTDKTLNGSEQHVPRSVAEYACAVGQASVCPFPRRGAPGWHEAMAEQEKLRKPNPMDTCVPNVFPPVWEVCQLPISGLPSILLRHGSEVSRWESLYFYDDKGDRHNALPASCPASIRKHFEDLAAASDPDQIAAANENALQARIKSEAHEKSRAGKMLARLGIVAKS